MTSDIKYSLVSLVNTELQIWDNSISLWTGHMLPSSYSIVIASGLSGQSSEGASVDYFVIFHSDFILGFCCRFGNSIAVGGQWIEYFDEIEIVQRIHSRP